MELFDQQGFGAELRSRRRRKGARMTSADDEHLGLHDLRDVAVRDLRLLSEPVRALRLGLAGEQRLNIHALGLRQRRSSGLTDGFRGAGRAGNAVDLVRLRRKELLGELVCGGSADFSRFAA